jgi:hypothetical protein
LQISVNEFEDSAFNKNILVLFSQTGVWPILSILFKPFGFIAPKTLNYLAFQLFDFERT